jgi:hypothetical protein
MRLRHRLVGDRDLAGVVAGAADQPFLVLEGAHAVGVHPGDQLLHLAHHLGADAVAGKQQELVGRHVVFLTRLNLSFQVRTGARPE